MSVAVVIPWRAGCEYREAALAWVTARHEAEGRTVVVGTHYTGPWCKAAAVTDALARTDADVLVIIDADVWIPNLDRAIASLAEAPWVMPHTMVHRLTASATAAVIAGGELGGDLERPGPYVGKVGGGSVVLRRETFEACPLDPRFVGWGQEDEAHGLALDVIAGPHVRLSEPLWHLWHPPQERIDRRIGSLEGRALWRRYQQASKRAGHGDRGHMDALVAEARTAAGGLDVYRPPGLDESIASDLH